MLRAFILALDHNPRRQMGNADRTRSFIHMLPARPSRPEGIDPNLGFLHFHFGEIFHFRNDIDGGKRGMAPFIGIKRRNADQAMDPAFGLEIAVGIRPLN